jgi:hypothetical protein
VLPITHPVRVADENCCWQFARCRWVSAQAQTGFRRQFVGFTGVDLLVREHPVVPRKVVAPGGERAIDLRVTKSAQRSSPTFCLTLRAGSDRLRPLPQPARAAVMLPDELPKPVIAHVLFTDVVGYSRLTTDQQTETLHELQRVILGSMEFSRAQGKQ